MSCFIPFDYSLQFLIPSRKFKSKYQSKYHAGDLNESFISGSVNMLASTIHNMLAITITTLTLIIASSSIVPPLKCDIACTSSEKEHNDFEIKKLSREVKHLQNHVLCKILMTVLQVGNLYFDTRPSLIIFCSPAYFTQAVGQSSALQQISKICICLKPVNKIYRFQLSLSIVNQFYFFESMIELQGCSCQLN